MIVVGLEHAEMSVCNHGLGCLATFADDKKASADVVSVFSGGVSGPGVFVHEIRAA